MLYSILASILLWSTVIFDDCDCVGTKPVEIEYDRSEFVAKGRVLSKSTVGLLATMDEAKSLLLLKVIDEDNEAISNEYRKFLNDDRITQVEFKVEYSFKGGFQYDTVLIFTLPNEASCGFNFTINSEYLIYANDRTNMYRFNALKGNVPNNLEKRNSFWTSLCSRTTALFEEDFKQLKVITKK